VAVAVFAAYAVSRYAFRGKRIFTTAVLSTQMFPGILFALPLFLIFVSIGNATGIPLYGSRGGLIITYLTFSLPFAIWDYGYDARFGLVYVDYPTQRRTMKDSGRRYAEIIASQRRRAAVTPGGSPA
jgi:Glycosyl hydrolase family 1